MVKNQRTFALLLAAGGLVFLAYGPLLTASSWLSPVCGGGSAALVVATMWRTRGSPWADMALALSALLLGYALPITLLAIVE